ncbi:flagellar motor switch protein FliM [Halioglobus japonicus]|uniref:Flagellar motor switch protein FliM n=1 Tax=Halioglobus japonicus TaxID=930805 RepID=A0AAP8SN18_9GAMM|nr:flagellar motor switch protein FliM [Halioglobus japonicus]AQA18093.1 flagellar motor switch protein FliM [Halioglobus japonicus]PLW86084.1 flagellar motor switch protein FliM [Halioglobus japonicus]GHD14562.1 flagellar motor switch protein FliM [Halioglobus japonicus]
MAESDLLLQDEIDALLNSVSGDEESAENSREVEARIRPYDPRTQSRIIKERLHGLDMINQRFARLFRVGLFNLIRRNADINCDFMKFESYSTYSKNVPVPSNINLVNIKPLRGTALFVFPPDIVFLVVDSLFGGDGRFLTRSEGREFTATEQRIIHRLLDLAIEAYVEAWRPIYEIHVEYVRSEMQVKFANITNSPNEVIVNTNFHLEVGASTMSFQVCIPYTMIEPIRDALINPVEKNEEEGEAPFRDRFSNEIKGSQVELIVDFCQIPTSIGSILSLKAGDILPVNLPDSIPGHVNGVPILECGYGSRGGHRALSVKQVLNISQDQFEQDTESR